VQEIAKLHGATITLTEDADGMGNTFTVTFPQGSPAPVSVL
jgi:two-component system sensor histidine kinase TctE